MATTRRGQFGNITEINGGTVYSDPRDNPNFEGYVAPGSSGVNQPLPPVNTISAPNLTSRAYTAPTPIPSTSSSGLAAMTGSIRDAAIKGYQDTESQQETDIKDITDTLGNEPIKRQSLYESTGVNKAQTEVTDLTNQMEARQHYYDRRIQDLEDNNPEGKFAGGLENETNRLKLDNAREQADLAISLSAKTRNFANLKSIVDAKVDAETESLKTRLDSLKFFYSANEGKLTKAQDLQTQEEIKKADREYTETKDLRTDIGNIQIKAAQGNAPASVISAIGNSKDLTEAIAKAAAYLGDTTGGSGSFTQTQINNGASSAGVPIDTFKGFDADTKNFFINGDINGTKKTIDDAFAKDGATLDEVTAEINAMNLPAAGAKYLNDYAKSVSDKNAPLTPEQTTATLVKSLTDLKTGGYTRAEAQDAVIAQLTDTGKTKISKSLQDSVQDALVKVFGRTFWQRVLPYGR